MPVPPYVLAASTTGPAHLRGGLPCQDAFAFSVLAGGTAVAAVADGLGSATWSRLGAAIAVEAAVASCVAERSPAAAIAAARVALVAAAAAVAAPLGDFACTLLVCLATPDEVVTAHVGDGAAVIECAGAFDVLSPPGDSEYVDEVVPLTSQAWDQESRVAKGRGRSVALFTDGCQRAALTRAGGWAAHPGWWGPIFGYARSAPTPESGSEQLAALLGGRRLSEHSDDDKTLLIVTLA